MKKLGDKPIDNLANLLELKNVTENTADLYFYGDIVSSWWGAWDDTDQYPESVKKFLDGAKGKNLNIHINSGGGSVFAGIAIYNMLRYHNGFKTVYVDGVAASIASVIALAGDKVVMRTGSTLMVHKPLYSIWGMYNADDMRKMADDLDRVQECIMQVYKENLREGVELNIIEKMVNAETWLPAEDAEKYFNVEIETTLQAVACDSEYLAKFFDVPTQVLEKQKLISAKKQAQAQAQLNLFKLGGMING